MTLARELSCQRLTQPGSDGGPTIILTSEGDTPSDPRIREAMESLLPPPSLDYDFESFTHLQLSQGQTSHADHTIIRGARVGGKNLIGGAGGRSDEVTTGSNGIAQRFDSRRLLVQSMLKARFDRSTQARAVPADNSSEDGGVSEWRLVLRQAARREYRWWSPPRIGNSIT